MTPFDAGLQPERTGLAWLRTTLTLAVGSLVAVRVLPPTGGVVWLVPGLVGLGLAVGASIVAHRRYRRLHLRLTGGPADALPGGGALVLVTAVTTGLLGVSALAFVLAW